MMFRSATVMPLNKKILRFYFSTLNIAELEQANKLSRVYRFSQAAQNYQRVMQILSSSKLHNSSQFYNVVSKLVACLFMTRKYSNITSLVNQTCLQNEGIEQKYHTYFMFTYALSFCQMKLPIQPINHPNFNTISHLAQRILSDPTLPQNHQEYVLNHISTNLNCQSNYQQLFVSLIQRNNRKLKQGQIEYPNLSNPQLELLFQMGLILNDKFKNSNQKILSNQRINDILKLYEQDRKDQVYKPLIGLVMSLITQKQYMAAEGMLGHIKSGESGLFYGEKDGVTNDTQDHHLVNNLYRMLVTRANHQSYEQGWKNEAPVNLGLLVAERIASAPVFNHQIF